MIRGDKATTALPGLVYFFSNTVTTAVFTVRHTAREYRDFQPQHFLSFFSWISHSSSSLELRQTLGFLLLDNIHVCYQQWRQESVPVISFSDAACT
jgi:hypothetical protein